MMTREGSAHIQPEHRNGRGDPDPDLGRDRTRARKRSVAAATSDAVTRRPRLLAYRSHTPTVGRHPDDEMKNLAGWLRRS